MYKPAAIMNFNVIMAFFCASSMEINLTVKIRCGLDSGSTIGIQCEDLKYTLENKFSIKMA